jgi:hypothetical protein
MAKQHTNTETTNIDVYDTASGISLRCRHEVSLPGNLLPDPLFFPLPDGQLLLSNSATAATDRCRAADNAYFLHYSIRIWEEALGKHWQSEFKRSWASTGSQEFKRSWASKFSPFTPSR